MTLRTVVALAVCALALLILPWIIGNEFYVNMATQVLIYALFALSINMMLGYGGMVSLGHAGYLGIAGYACILAVTAGYDHLTAAIFAVALSTAAAAFFGLLSLRAPGLGFIMITLALGQIVWGIAYRANDLTGGDNGIRYPGRPMPFGFDLRDAAFPVRSEPDGNARPAPAHANARLQCLADPVAHVRHGRVLGLGRRRPLRLLQSVPQPARDLAATVGRDPADGDPRRR
jgi:ABC-type branched-subunit amino acid transport system permease subunit